MRNKMKKFWIGTMVVGAMLCGSCSDDEGGNKTRKDIPMSRAEVELVSCGNEFTQKLVGALNAGEEKPKNFVVSPLSVSMAMCMLADGAAGETQAEILRALGYASEDIEDANALNKKLMAELPKADAKTKVALANRLWYTDKYSDLYRDSYRETLSAYYGASFAGLKDLGGQEGMDAINKWVKQNTQGMIPEFLKEPLQGEPLMVLTNAVYFKGRWAEKFDKSKTSKEVFHNADGSLAQVSMMKNPALRAQAYQDAEAGYKLALLNYGNTAYCMAVILPDEGRDPAEVFADMNLKDMSEYVMNTSLGKESLNFWMPRFETESEFSLRSVLESMGIRSIFKRGGDYSEMFEAPVSEFLINKVLHGAKIIVDEEGTEAAAATAIYGDVAAGPIMTNDFIVDRPFAYAIVERSTGVILFAGTVTQF